MQPKRNQNATYFLHFEKQVKSAVLNRQEQHIMNV